MLRAASGSSVISKSAPLCGHELLDDHAVRHIHEAETLARRGRRRQRGVIASSKRQREQWRRRREESTTR
jgi:hypothetical protein